MNKKFTRKYFFIFLLSFLILFFGAGLVKAQDINTSATSTEPHVLILPNPYANLSPEEQAKLPLSAKEPDIKEQVSVDVNPEVPQPGETVTINVSAYGGIDIDAAQINWVMNGKSVLKGQGEKQFIFKAGTDGQSNKIELHIQPKYGAEVIKNFNFKPSDVDVLWQANTYTPPFYKGKALYTPEAYVQFVAMPNITNDVGAKIQPSKAIYNWRIDHTNYADKSGYGKNFYDFSGSILAKPTSVEVTAYDPFNKDSTGVGSLDVGPVQPALVMYEIHPTYGPIFNTAAIGTYNFGAQDLQMGAYPYFFSTGSKKSIPYVWKINGTTLDTLPQNQDFLVLQKVKQDSGQSTIDVSASNGDKVLQQAGTQLDLIY
ncbi:MAG: hypothetical protein WCG97_00905 [bacterium]